MDGGWEWIEFSVYYKIVVYLDFLYFIQCITYSLFRIFSMIFYVTASLNKVFNIAAIFSSTIDESIKYAFDFLSLV